MIKFDAGMHSILHKIATHLSNQKVLSSNSTGGCFYRGPNGTMCAVGCLIPDDVYEGYKDIIEGNSVNSLATSTKYFPGIITNISPASDPHSLECFLSVAQYYHDNHMGEFGTVQEVAEGILSRLRYMHEVTTYDVHFAADGERIAQTQRDAGWSEELIKAYHDHQVQMINEVYTKIPLDKPRGITLGAGLACDNSWLLNK